MSYNNKTGIVTAIEDDAIFIDNDMFLTDTKRSKERMAQTCPQVGDKVEFNFNEKTGDLIYLRMFIPGPAAGNRRPVTIDDVIEVGGIMFCPDQDDPNPFGDEFIEYGHNLE
jgi:hypothetical protein